MTSTAQPDHLAHRFRYGVASALLFAVIFVPMLLTLRYSSIRTNEFTAYLQLAFALTLLPESLREFRASLNTSPVVRFAALCLLVSVVGWCLLFIPLVERSRTLVYAVQPLFLAAAIAWFRRLQGDGLRTLFYFKLFSVLVALLIISHFLMTLPETVDKMVVKGSPPVYRHLRHLNYDLAVVFSLGLLLLAAECRTSQVLQVVAYVVIGYFSIWSSGRGQFLSMAIFLSLIVGFKVMNPRGTAMMRPLLAFVAGGVLVFAVDATYLVFDTLRYSAALESVNRMSAGRLDIWEQSLRQLHESWVVGFGPDGFLYWWAAVSSANIVQPHNFVVQWLLEFGVIGAAGLMALLGKLLLLCLGEMRNARGTTAPAIVSALLVSLVIFALFDGNFYHGIPLAMFLLLAAYLVSVSGKGRAEVGKGEIGAFI